MRGVWSHDAVGLVIAATLLPAIAAVLFEIGATAVPVMAVSAVVIAGWQLLFRATLGVPLSATGAVTAVALAVYAPADAPLWQVLLAASFGTVIGELIFGGWGRNFLSAAAVALGFLYLSMPTAQPADAGLLLALAALLGGLILWAAGILAWAVPAAGIGGFVLLSAALGTTEAALPALGTYAFALVWIAADPVAAAATRTGRWVYGALAGALAALLATGATPAQAAIFAALLASIFAPLIDQGVIAAETHFRRRRHG